MNNDIIIPNKHSKYLSNMTYDRTSKDILAMIYELAKADRIYKGQELYDYLESRIDGKSKRTIMRWIDYLKGLEPNYYSFDYTGYPDVRKLGLVKVRTVCYDPIHLDFSLLIPHNYDHTIGHDRTMRRLYILEYLVPPERVKDLIDLIDHMKVKGIISDYSHDIVDKFFLIPSPYHRMINNGSIEIPEDIDNTFFTKRIKIKYYPSEMTQLIHNNPILIPIIFENNKDTFSTKKVANEIQKHLGDRLFTYLNKRMSTNQFINLVGKFEKRLFNNFDEYYELVMIYYKSFLEVKDHIYFYAIIDYKKMDDDFRNFIELLSRKNFYIGGECLHNENTPSKMRIGLHSNFKGIYESLQMLKEYDPGFEFYLIDTIGSLKIQDRNHQKFHYWDLFDPIEKRWIFEKEKYMAAIDDFADKVQKGEWVDIPRFTW